MQICDIFRAKIVDVAHKALTTDGHAGQQYVLTGKEALSNDEVAHYCRAHADRFIGIASVDLYRPMDGVRELRRRVRQDGFKGLRILPWVWGLPR